MIWVAGGDGCKAGWFVVLCELTSGSMVYEVKATFAEVLNLAQFPTTIAVDIPIGLLDVAERGGRSCDRRARCLLERRRNSVFSPPVRSALRYEKYEDACRANRMSSPLQIGISKQCHAVFKKLREVDEILRKQMPIEARVHEVHPELCFRAIAGSPAKSPKKKKSGYLERKGLLLEFRTIIEKFERERPQNVAKDDILDACAACWSAERIHNKTANRIPDDPTIDSRGLRMEMWY